MPRWGAVGVGTPPISTVILSEGRKEYIMEWWHVYLFTRLDALKDIAESTAILSAIGLVIVGIVYGISYYEYSPVSKHARPTLKKCTKLICCFFCVGISLWVVVPSQKEAAAIYLLPKLAKSELASEASQIPADAAKLLRLKLESWIAGMEPKKEGAK